MILLPVRRRISTPRGFTLIELLVVIAIIAILAAILFPVFAKAREKAYQTQCLNNQRQLAIGLLSYAQDHDEALPLPNQWVEATSLASDPKVFNCPSNGHIGSPADPDYGMNAYLFTTDPSTNERTELALGAIDDPSSLELTGDLDEATAASVAVDPANPTATERAKQDFTNPFPKSFTLPGFSSASVDFRHPLDGGIIVSYVDGHIRCLLKKDLTNCVPNQYAIPPGNGRFFIDFAAITSQTECDILMNQVWQFAAPQNKSIGVTYNPTDKTLDLTNGILRSAAYPDYGGDTGSLGTTYVLGTLCSFGLTGTVADGASIKWGVNQAWAGVGCNAPTGDDQEKGRWDCAFDVDTANNYIQFGQLRGWTANTGYPSNPNYPVNAWFDLPSYMKGERQTIGASTASIQIDSNVNWNALTPRFPSNQNAYYEVYAGQNVLTSTLDASSIVQGAQNSLITVNGHETKTSTRPFHSLYQEVRYGNRELTVNNGTLKIKTLYFSSGS